MGTDQEENVSSDPNAKRSQFRRKRQFKDVLDQAVLYTKNGLLSELPSSHVDYLSSTAEEFSVVAGITPCGAKRVLSLMKIHENRDLCQYLSEHAALRVFHASEFAKGNRTIQSAGGTMDIDLLRVLVAVDEEKSSDPMKKMKMAAIISQFQPEARKLLVLACFKMSGVIATLSGWVKEEPFTMEELASIFKRLHSDAWNTQDMPDQHGKAFSRRNMTSGWNLVNEVMKIQIQEIHGCFVAAKETSLMARDRNYLRDEASITSQHVEENLITCCEFVLREFCAWVYSLGLISDKESSDMFADKISAALNRLFAELLLEIHPVRKQPLEKPSYHCVDISELKKLLSCIEDGEPSMADVKYGLHRMMPCLRRTRSSTLSPVTLEKLLRRCRREGSRVVERARDLPYQIEAGQEGDGQAVDYADDDDEIEISTEDNPSDSYIPDDQPHLSARIIGPMKQKDAGAANCRDNALVENREEAEEGSRGDELMGVDEMELSPACRELDDEIPPQYPSWLRDFGRFLPAPKRQPPRRQLFPDNLLGHHVERRTKSVPKSVLRENSFSRTRKPQPVRDINYAADLPDSDNEFTVQAYPRESQTTSFLGDRTLSADLEDFFAEMLSWTVHPGDSSRRNIVTSNKEWLTWFSHLKRRFILQDVTMSTSVKQYSNHWQCILYMELRGSVADAFSTKFPNIKSSSAHEFQRSIFSSGLSQFVMVQIRKVSHSRLLTNFVCESTDVQLNRKIVKELAGMTLCFGYFERADDDLPEKPVKLEMILCRRVYVDEDDFDRVGLAGKVDRVFLRVCTNRVTTRSFGPEPGDFLHIQSFYSVASVVRMFRACHLTLKLPVEIQHVLFGPHPPQILDQSVKLHGGRHDVTKLLPGVDPGSLQYLRNLISDPDFSTMNQHQFEALVIALEGIGDAKPESSSMSMILGPPGTGKTTCITLLIGALLHHSTWGQVGAAEVYNELQRSDGLVRSSKKEGAFKILVCCSSNQGVDNVLRKLRNGLPDGKGGRLFVQCVRVARQDYDYKDLDEYSMNTRALPFDLEIFRKGKGSPDSLARKMPSLKAKRALARESIVFLFTNSLSGGSKFAELKTDCDIVIKDEVSQSLEPESLIPLTATRRQSQLSRLHYVGAGDFNQLPPLSMTDPLVRNTNVILPFCYGQQVNSQFERMFSRARCARAMLMSQYRMHPTISIPHSRQFYRGIISNPSPKAFFEESYNQHNDGQIGFYPLTFWDTCLDKTRLEQDKGNGLISNEYEANLVDRAIRKLISLEGFENLRGKISVIAPYRAQVDLINYVLQSPLRSLHNPKISRRLDVLVCTVDSMQGSERDIVIFSGTRSNVQGIVGFLDNPKRLNVAVSRARKLLLIVGDSETLFTVPVFRFFIHTCREGRDGAGLVMITPGLGNEIARPITRGGSMNLHRRRTGYNLRSFRQEESSSRFPSVNSGGVARPGWRPR